jgi:hypothetical protein
MSEVVGQGFDDIRIAQLAMKSNRTTQSHMTNQRPLRLGLLLGSKIQPAWVARSIDLIVEQGHAQVCLVVLNQKTSASLPTRRPFIFRRLTLWWKERQKLLYAWYLCFDRWKFSVDSDPFADVDLSSRLVGVPTVEVAPQPKNSCDYFPEESVAAIRTHDLDVAWRVGFRNLRFDTLNIAKLGVWSYHHGNNARYRGGPAGFWEVLDATPQTGAAVQVLSEELGGGHVLQRTWSASDRFSLQRNRASIFWQATPLFARALRDAALGLSKNSELLGYSHRMYVAPRNAEIVAPLSRLAWRYIRQQVAARLIGEQWFLLYHQEPSRIDNSAIPDLAPYRFLPIFPPTDRYWADPFVLRYEDRHLILFEELIYTENRGKISVIEVDAAGKRSNPRAVLETPHHLSYPFLLRYEGEIYMLPETSMEKRIYLYRARHFPDEWELVSTMLEGEHLTDSTIEHIGDRWWLFAGFAGESESNSADLLAYHSPNPFGPWTPHCRNPIVSDVRSARPAGRLFQRNGKWYRPAQDCSRSYGSAVVIQRIDSLTPSAYSETTISRIDPSWQPNLVGTHTINCDGGMTVIDARRRFRITTT